MRLTRFDLPPVQSALVIGHKSIIGPEAFRRALQEMMPDSFEAVDVPDSEVIQCVLVNVKHTRRIPPERLVALIVSHAEGIMDAGEALAVDLDIEARVQTEIEL